MDVDSILIIINTGPKKFPVLGNLPQLALEARKGKRPYVVLKDLSKRYGHRMSIHFGATYQGLCACHVESCPVYFIILNVSIPFSPISLTHFTLVVLVELFHWCLQPSGSIVQSPRKCTEMIFSLCLTSFQFFP